MGGTAPAPRSAVATTDDYYVVMAVVSIRFQDPAHHERLKVAARRAGTAVSPLAERLIEEGLRMEAHPQIVFRSGPAGRRPTLVGGPEVVDVVGAIVGGDVPAAERRRRAAAVLAISEAQVDAAMAYYAEFTEEVDAEMVARRDEATAAEAAWRRQRDLLGS